MGKLHKLRREIEKDPERWYSRTYGGFTYIHGAYFQGNKPMPSRMYNTHYNRYVKSILEKLGVDLSNRRFYDKTIPKVVITGYLRPSGGTIGTKIE